MALYRQSPHTYRILAVVDRARALMAAEVAHTPREEECQASGCRQRLRRCEHVMKDKGWAVRTVRAGIQSPMGRTQ